VAQTSRSYVSFINVYRRVVDNPRELNLDDDLESIAEQRVLEWFQLGSHECVILDIAFPNMFSIGGSGGSDTLSRYNDVVTEACRHVRAAVKRSLHAKSSRHCLV